MEQEKRSVPNSGSGLVAWNFFVVVAETSSEKILYSWDSTLSKNVKTGRKKKQTEKKGRGKYSQK